MGFELVQYVTLGHLRPAATSCKTRSACDQRMLCRLLLCSPRMKNANATGVSVAIGSCMCGAHNS